DPYLDGSGPNDPQGRHETGRMDRRLRTVECRYRAGMRPFRPRTDRKGHVGDARSDGRDAGAEDRASEGRGEHRMGAVADCRNPSRDALSSGGRCQRSGETEEPPALQAGRYPVGAGRNPPELDTGRHPGGNRQQRTRHSGLCRALGRSGRRLLQGAGHQQCRPDGRPRYAAHLRAAHRQLALSWRRDRGAGDGNYEAHGSSRRQAERRRSALSPDGGGLRQVHRIPGRLRSRLQGPRTAERLHRAGPASPPPGVETGVLIFTASSPSSWWCPERSEGNRLEGLRGTSDPMAILLPTARTGLSCVSLGPSRLRAAPQDEGRMRLPDGCNLLTAGEIPPFSFTSWIKRTISVKPIATDKAPAMN